MNALREPREQRASQFRGTTGSWAGRSALLFGLLVLGPCGCGATRPLADGGPVVQAPPGSGQLRDRASPPEPQPRALDEAPSGLDGPRPEPISRGQSEPVFERYSQDLMELRVEVAARCGNARANEEQDFLVPLVSDLYLSGADPADAAEALILGDCGPLASIVRELVAQGGDRAVAPVVQRALRLSGPEAKPVVESAASMGLELNSDALDARPEAPAGDGSLSYAMAYFPSRGKVRGLKAANAVNSLFSNVTPGYGIYTFVFPGAGFDAQSETEQARFRELLRVIETYVLVEDGIRDPNPEAHAFLIPVYPERADAPLADQTGPELSDPIRRDFAGYLRSQGQSDLARRLETGPGPFLISSPEPRLLPADAASPRLVADLSAIGSEYLYGVVDSYDRPVPVHPSGRADGLAQIRERLIGLVTQRVPEEGQDASIKDAWVFLVDRNARAASSVSVRESAAKAHSGKNPGPDRLRPAMIRSALPEASRS